MSDERDSLKTCVYEEVNRRRPTEIMVPFGMRRMPIFLSLSMTKMLKDIEGKGGQFCPAGRGEALRQVVQRRFNHGEGERSLLASTSTLPPPKFPFPAPRSPLPGSLLPPLLSFQVNL